MIFAIGSVAAVALMLLAGPLIHWLFERGSFTSENTRQVANILVLYAIQLPFYVGSMLIIRLVSAMRANAMLLWISAGNITINIVLNYILMRKIGVAGIALSTSIVYIISFAFLFAYFRIKLKETSR
jgi:putative peptidoglycan lipid II flippase